MRAVPGRGYIIRGRCGGRLVAGKASVSPGITELLFPFGIASNRHGDTIRRLQLGLMDMAFNSNLWAQLLLCPQALIQGLGFPLCTDG